MANRTPILNLDTLVERAVVRIDGTDYELLNPGELSVLDFHKIGKRAERVEAMLKEEGDLSEDQVVTLTEALDALCRLVLRAPAEVHARLSDTQRLKVTQAFTVLQREQPGPPAGGDDVPTAPSTGESNSPAS